MRKAFSLLELAIVITIIGFIFSIIISFKYIISNFQIKHTITSLYEYKLGFIEFYRSYQEIPGDSKKGYNFFADKYCTDLSYHSLNNRGCNGNGNSIMNFTKDIDSREIILAWYHLYKAGFLNFNNKNDAYNLDYHDPIFYNKCKNKLSYNISYNIPSLKIRKAGIFIDKITANNNNIKIFLSLLKGNSCNIKEYSGIFTIKEIINIDLKYDDGNPQTGNISLESDICYYNKEYNNLYKKDDCKINYNFNLN